MREINHSTCNVNWIVIVRLSFVPMLGQRLRREGAVQASETRRWLTLTTKAKAVSRVRGTRDLLADDSQQHREVLDRLQSTVERYGFRSVRVECQINAWSGGCFNILTTDCFQIQTPLLEYTDLFSRSLGDGSDIVMKVCGSGRPDDHG